ncbi:hypothetical protein [Acinetobacter proteolyticus]|uniref:Uncharacterized protein n=1 Tax=Acinetobacter proteolyticus TaxID=1776741 RepID=A0A2N0WI88_9GAMM|nr:hypothetical protein [Acinetobacter proteolyticus]MBK5646238.1 hypothetical protein [Acinetobacter sp.]PKF35512.1 hypothetical protein CW311_04275 [Acinetobacter proteolyticus]
MSKQEVLKLYPNLKCVRTQKHPSLFEIQTETGRCFYEGGYSAKKTWWGLYTRIQRDPDYDPYWRDKMYNEDGSYK